MSGGERIIRVVNDHWIRYVVPTVVFVLLAGVSVLLLLLAGVSAHHAMWLSHLSFIAGLLLLAISVHWYFVFLLSESLGVIVVTNRRLLNLQTRLFLRDSMQEIAFEKMKSVEARKVGVLQNVLHYGTLYFEKGTSVAFVPHPNGVARDIEQAMGLR